MKPVFNKFWLWVTAGIAIGALIPAAKLWTVALVVGLAVLVVGVLGLALVGALFVLLCRATYLERQAEARLQASEPPGTFAESQENLSEVGKTPEEAEWPEEV